MGGRILHGVTNAEDLGLPIAEEPAVRACVVHAEDGVVTAPARSAAEDPATVQLAP
ncbi:hypothetical protein [Kitasatospora sp. NPDC085879]|uniref:hypothetical protein n=1 Tax=Kitasatospora sp. NPDC085879 TaxID=3154769 RepID=UPI00342F8F13